MGAPRRAPSLAKRVGRLGIVAAFAFVLGASVSLYALVHERPRGNPAEVEVQIPRGATNEVVVARLRAVGLARRPRLVGWVLRLTGAVDAVRAGTHRLPGDATPLEVADALLGEPARQQVSLTLIPGQNLWQHAKRLAAAGVGEAGELLRLAADREQVGALGLPVGPERPPRSDGVAHTYLEGFLFPETYFLRPDATTADCVAIAVRQFHKEWKRLEGQYAADLLALRARFPKLDSFAIVTLASLVEEEAAVPTEAPAIAGVFYNRMARGMRLQTDPTLVYHPERVGRAPTPRDRRDRTNPYNTYAHDGLPPGPICSPGRNALLATIRPERHDYLYFVARRDGRRTHVFARTLPEHRANVERYLGGGSN